MKKYMVPLKNILVDVYSVRYLCKYEVGFKNENPYCIKIKSDDAVFTVDYKNVQDRDRDYDNLQALVLKFGKKKL